MTSHSSASRALRVAAGALDRRRRPRALPSRARSMSTPIVRASSSSRCSTPSPRTPASRSTSSRRARASSSASRPKAPTVPADVLLTVDIGRIEDAVRAGITQPIKSDVLDKVVAPQYRDPEGHWYGISMRARVVYASKERVHADRHHLRGARRSEMEGQDLHPLGPVHLQQRAVRGLHRPSRRSQDRGMAQAASRPISRRSRRAATARSRATSRPASATSASATPTTGR